MTEWLWFKNDCFVIITTLNPIRWQIAFIIFHLNSTVPIPGRGAGAAADDGNNFTMMSIFMILAVIMYIFRPNSLRRQRQNNADEKQPLSNGQVSTVIAIISFSFSSKYIVYAQWHNEFHFFFIHISRDRMMMVRHHHQQ